MMCNLLACDVLLVGSSVARGQAAPSGKGWGELLAKELRNKYGFQMVNAAIPGTDTTATLQAMKVRALPDSVVDDAEVRLLRLMCAIEALRLQTATAVAFFSKLGCECAVASLACTESVTMNVHVCPQMPSLLWQVALKTCKPCAVVIGLSLANEGLFLARDVSEIDRVRDRFLDGMQKLAETAQASGAMPVIGGVYPNDFYEPVHAQTLRSVEATMRGWTTSRGWKYISFLSALDDGEGRWQRGLSADPSHPNEEGHKAMFDAIDISLFDELVKRT
eukprot:6200743-Pleurochrysis_carterae.AAC.3